MEDEYCPECDTLLEDEHCPNCGYSRNNDMSVHTRQIDLKSDKFIDKDNIGNIIKSKRIFGVEIEALCTNGYELNRLEKSHGLCGDASINGNGVAFEIQTARLSGKKGEDEIYRICDVLRSADAFVNPTCGLHLHIDLTAIFNKITNDRTKLDTAKNILRFYLVAESVILSMIPKRRRTNNYCRDLRLDYNYNQIGNARTLDKLEKIWYNVNNKKIIKERKKTKDSTRYHGVNLHSLLADGHLEIRYHSGTINAEKILRWANLHLLIIDKLVLHQYDLFIPTSDVLLKDQVARFFNFLGVGEEDRKYWEMRINKFNDNILKNFEKVESVDNNEENK